jgi:hypothetical protein
MHIGVFIITDTNNTTQCESNYLICQDPHADSAKSILNPQLNLTLLATTTTTISLRLPRHNGDYHYRLTDTGFLGDTSKEGRDTTAATIT